MTNLCTAIINVTDQNLRSSRGSMVCDLSRDGNMDIPLSTLVQLSLMNNEEVLTTRTLWSDALVQSAHSACMDDINLEVISPALCEVAR